MQVMLPPSQARRSHGRRRRLEQERKLAPLYPGQRLVMA